MSRKGVGDDEKMVEGEDKQLSYQLQRLGWGEIPFCKWTPVQGSRRL
jgi:hypothetical protein